MKKPNTLILYLSGRPKDLKAENKMAIHFLVQKEKKEQAIGCHQTKF